MRTLTTVVGGLVLVVLAAYAIGYVAGLMGGVLF